jgi:hypothetical protein
MAKVNHKNIIDTDEMRSRIYEHAIDVEWDGIYLKDDATEYNICWVPAEERWGIWVTEDGKVEFWDFDDLESHLEAVSDDAIEAFYFEKIAEYFDEDEEIEV